MAGIGLPNGMKMLLTLVGLWIGFNMAFFIGQLLIGATAYQAQSGNVDVVTTINDSINTSATNLSTQAGYFQTGVNFVLGLVTLVVLISVFKEYIPQIRSGNKGGGMV